MQIQIVVVNPTRKKWHDFGNTYTAILVLLKHKQ